MGVGSVRRRRLGLGALLLVTTILVILALPREDVVLKKIGIDEPLKIRRGLDLQGGVYLVYEADMASLPQDQSAKTSDVLNNARAVIERRVNPGGAGEAIVQTAAGNRVVVQIPGLADPAEAISTIGKTALLEFYEVTTQGQDASAQGLIPTDVSGKDVQRATVDFQPQTNQPIVSLQLKGGDSTQKFGDLTTRLAGSPNLLVTLLDGEVVFGPATVQQPITNGQAQLSGNFTVKEAKQIATLLNAGALPVPIKLVAQATIGPTLGALSIKHSLVAAMIGLLSVAAFLLIYYRWAGLVAMAALIFYSLALASIIKLSVFTPYVMVITLAGIAGFILSIAVAVDANILILERVKEELAAGSNPVKAMVGGFDHAWTSIRDANATTIISSFILYVFGTPLIKGFALTLGVGVALSLLTVVTVSKLLLRTLSRSRLVERPGWVGLTYGFGKEPSR
ncbi:protein translocase subunit SecD [Candidatus Microgenomates bacterium]|nr:protein translocase subunit SecD [Candidatus Microgenomates bacterium]